MSPNDFRSALELVGLIKSKALSPADLMEETIRRIETINPTINAFVALRAEQAMEEARRLADRIAAGEDPGPLAGVPIGVKDLEDVAGMVTSFGSVPYKDNVVQIDSVQVERLKAAGAVIIGKTNTPEFGFTGFTKNRLHGVTRNPWNTERTPGGSSGGSAAAVAAGMTPIATGSDAGGSIRIPASYSGCFGLKPSFGRIPTGPFPLLQMYDLWTVGPLTWTVSDAATYLDCTSGYHPADPGSLPHRGSSYADCLEDMPRQLKIAYSRTLGYARVQADVQAQVDRAVSTFEQMGHGVEEWMETLPDVGPAWANLMNCELFGLLHQDLDKYRDDMGRTLVKSLDHAGSFSTREQVDAQKARTDLNRKMGDLFAQYDLFVTPTMPTEAFAAKGPPPAEIDGQPIPLLGAVAFTYPFNMSRHPAASVPAGFTTQELPVGLQIIGPRHRDDLVLQVSYAYEQMRPWNDRRPSLPEA
jgi:aspartyl-tRNA(Asn)/glutamyl-tRNA(Gln) amidotransferase subunit A